MCMYYACAATTSQDHAPREEIEPGFHLEKNWSGEINGYAWQFHAPCPPPQLTVDMN